MKLTRIARISALLGTLLYPYICCNIVYCICTSLARRRTNISNTKIHSYYLRSDNLLNRCLDLCNTFLDTFVVYCPESSGKLGNLSIALLRKLYSYVGKYGSLLCVSSNVKCVHSVLTRCAVVMQRQAFVEGYTRITPMLR